MTSSFDAARDALAGGEQTFHPIPTKQTDRCALVASSMDDTERRKRLEARAERIGTAPSSPRWHRPSSSSNAAGRGPELRR